MVRYFVVIPCAGSGMRFQSELPKQYHELKGKTVLDWTLQAFSQVSAIDQMLLVADKDDKLIDNYATGYKNLVINKVGGNTRAQSVLNGINSLDLDTEDWVLVHDAARCCIAPTDIDNLIRQLKDSPTGGILAHKAVDTIKRVKSDLRVIDTLNREYIYLAQTPQMFRAGLLKQALLNADLSLVTDEASAVELLGKEVQIIECGKHNIKITYPEDILLAEFMLDLMQRKAVSIRGELGA